MCSDTICLFGPLAVEDVCCEGAVQAIILFGILNADLLVPDVVVAVGF